MKYMKKYHIGIGISAGIAGYKIIDLVSRLVTKNVKISVIMTENAIKMFGVKMFENASGNPVIHDLFPPEFDYSQVLRDKKVGHISLADNIDLLLIAPSTANILAKLAHGIADDYLTTLALSVTCPVLIAPSMNTNMWHNSFTRSNLKLLIDKGFHLIRPDSGELACGYQGVGRLRNLSEIEEYIFAVLQNAKMLKGNKVLITAGATAEPIDEIRYITNFASGKMGKSIAEEAYNRGAAVLLLRAKNAVEPDKPIKQEIFSSGKELTSLVRKYCPGHDIIFHSSAVSDFYPSRKFNGKMNSHRSFNVILHPMDKIITKIKKWNPQITLVGFKAVVSPQMKKIETAGNNLIRDSRADYVVINDVSRTDIGFGSDYNEVYLKSKQGTPLHKLSKNRKEIIAGKILDYIFNNN